MDTIGQLPSVRFHIQHILFSILSGIHRISGTQLLLSKKAGSFLSTAKQIDDLEEENVKNAPESGFEFDWQGE